MTLTGHHVARWLWRAGSGVAVILACTGVPAGVLAQVPAPPLAAPAAPAAVIQGIVQNVVVEGTQRVEPDSVLSYMSLRQGTPYDPVAADQSLKTLFETGLFADVRMNWDGMTLTVRVVENPIINQIVFEGNDAIDTDDLTAEVQMQPRMVFTRARVQGDVQRIITLYRRSGRFAATVEPVIIQRPQNRVDLIFQVREGPTTGIASINFVGNEVFSDSELRGRIVTTESAWWRFLSTNDNYDPDRITFDREQLRQYYLTRGYADFRVISAVAELSPDRRSFYITFTVDEGQRYNFGNVQIESQIEDLRPEELQPLLVTLPGDLFNAEDINDSIEALTFAAGTRGFVFIDIRPRIQRNIETGSIDVFFQIEEAPRVYVERINISGNTRTDDDVIRREFRVVEGDAFNRVLVDRSRTLVRALGFFSNVTVTEEPGSAADRTVLNVVVAEQPTGELSLGAGYSSESNLIGEFSYTERNLFGRGQFLRASISYSTIQKLYDFRFIEPTFLGRKLQAGFQIYKQLYNFSDQAGYLSDVVSGGLLFGFGISEYGRISPHYNYQVATITPSDIAGGSVALLAGRASTSWLGYTYTYDTRDDIFRPNAGWFFSFSQDIAGLGGDLNWLRTTAHLDYFRPLEILEFDFVGQVTFEGGYISAYSGQAVRIHERFFRGGYNFRGFELAGIGPRDLATRDRSALGGQLYLQNTLQLRLPAIIPDSYGITLSLFNDFGTLGYLRGVSSVCDMDGDVIENPVTGVPTFIPASCIKDNMAPRASAGLAINWRSPFGPVEIDIGYPYIQQPFDRVQAIFFRSTTSFY